MRIRLAFVIGKPPDEVFTLLLPPSLRPNHQRIGRRKRLFRETSPLSYATISFIMANSRHFLCIHDIRAVTQEGLRLLDIRHCAMPIQRNTPQKLDTLIHFKESTELTFVCSIHDNGS